jgi:hypothetical protein
MNRLKATLFSAFLFLPLLSQACELDDVLAAYEQELENRRLFAALDVLNNAEQTCPHPRITLEQGEIALKLGQTDNALARWESVLAMPGIPEAVEQKIKLKILQTRLNPPSPSRLQAVVSADQFYDQQAITGFGLNAVYRANQPAKNFFGYAMTPALFAKVSGNARYYWSSDLVSHATLLSTGIQANSRPLSAESALSIRNLNESVYVSADFATTFRLGPLSLREKVEVSLNQNPHRWLQTATLNLAPIRFSVQSNADLSETGLEWTEFSTRLQGQGTIRPGVALSYQPVTERTTGKATLRWAFHRNVWLNVEAGARLQNNVEWFTMGSLSWRLF